MPGLMIWCTCAENNKELYLRRVAGWYSQVKSIFGRFNPNYDYVCQYPTFLK